MDKSFLIYKHTSPSGKAYIGQTKNLARRNSSHRGDSGCRLFAKAIKRYGWDSFQHEVLASGLSLEEANRLEQELIQSHGTRAPHGYNLKAGGLSSEHAEETKQRISKAHIGKVVPPEVGQKISATKRAKTQEERDAINAKLRAANVGKKASAETKAKLSAAHTGRKMSPEAIEKSAAARRGRVASAETRAKQSASRKGRPAHNKGIPMPEEQKVKVSAAKKDPSPEVRARISEAAKAAWARRKQNGTGFHSPEHRAKIGASRKAKKEVAQSDLLRNDAAG